MRSSFFVIFVFLLVKFFQLFNSFIFAELLGDENGSKIMITSLFLMSGVFIFILLTKKFLPPSIFKFLFIYIIYFLMIIMILNTFLGLIFFMSFFFYELIYMESQVSKSLKNIKSISLAYSSTLTMVPFFISYLLFQQQTTTLQLFYIVSSIFVLISTYTTRPHDDEFVTDIERPYLWMGILSIIISLFLYYFVYLAIDNEPILLLFIIISYSLGALVIFSALNNYLQKKTRQNKKSNH